MMELLRKSVIEHYKGHVVMECEYRNSVGMYSTKWRFCKEGDICKPSLWDCGYYWSLEACKSKIDDVVDKGEISLTASEHKRWVTDSCENAEYGWTYEELKKIVKKYEKANERRKVGYIGMFHNANYHSFANALESGDEKEVKELLEEANHFMEKYEVVLNIKNKSLTKEKGRQLEGVIENALIEALSNCGVSFHKNLVTARFVEDW